MKDDHSCFYVNPPPCHPSFSPVDKRKIKIHSFSEKKLLDCCVGHLMKMKHAKHQQQRSLTIGKSTYQPPGRQCVRCSRSDASLKESEKLSLSLSIASVLGELTSSVFVGPGQTHHSPSVRFNQCLSTHCLRVCLPFLIQELGRYHSLVSIIPGFIGWVSLCAV